MKCEHCNNEMVWVGSMHDGSLSCDHCLNDDSRLTMKNGAEINFDPAVGGSFTVHGAGGGGGCSNKDAVVMGSNDQGGQAGVYAIEKTCPCCSGAGIVKTNHGTHLTYCPDCHGMGTVRVAVPQQAVTGDYTI